MRRRTSSIFSRFQICATFSKAANFPSLLWTFLAAGFFVPKSIGSADFWCFCGLRRPKGSLQDYKYDLQIVQRLLISLWR